MPSLSDLILHDLEAESENTRNMLRIVPADHFEWRPHAKSWTLVQLASHLAESPSWIPSMGEDEMDAGAMADYRPFVAKDSADLCDSFERNLAAGVEFLRGKDDAFMTRTWTMRAGDQIVMQQPKHEVIRMIALHHTIHHRGQLCVYLRLLDVPLPKIYGPTADDTSL